MRRCMIVPMGVSIQFIVRSLVQAHSESFSFCIWLKHLNKILFQYEPEHCNDLKSVFGLAVTQNSENKALEICKAV